MDKIAIVEKYPSRYNYNSIFPFEFDKFSLVEEKQEKVLKKDITLDITNLKKEFDYIILVGSEACKMVADIRSVTEYQGYLVDNKYLPLLNPNAVRIQPSKKMSFDKAVTDIISTISNKSVNLNDVTTIGITTEEEAELYLLELLNKIKSKEIREVAIDTETSALYPRDGYLLGISISYEDNIGAYINADVLTEEIIWILQEIINICTVIFFNAKYDKKWLEYHCGLVFNKFEDVMLQHYALDENDVHGLKALAIKYTELGDYDKDLTDFKVTYCRSNGILQKDFTYAYIPFNIIYKYAAIDAIATLRLYKKFYNLISNNNNLYNVYNFILKPGSNALQTIEENGIPLANKEKLKQYISNITNEIDELTKQLYLYEEVKEVEKIKGTLFNVNSTYHVTCLFFDILKLPVSKLTAGQKPSVDAEVLNKLSQEHEIANIINNIKKLKKIKATYLDKMLLGMDRDGRLRTFFNLHTTTSGRLSSSGKINAQQLPRDNKIVKKSIEAKEGFKIISQDLKTAEMYIAAVLSGDKNLQNIFVTGVDYHGHMAKLKFVLPCEPNEVAKLYSKLRQEAKTISFEILYKLNYNEPALENFGKLKQWLKTQEAYIKKNGYIYSFFGRKRRLADVFSPNKQEAQHQVRSGINFLVQSVASDINLLATIDMLRWIKENKYSKVMKIFMLVHDSIVAEVKDEYIEIYTKKLAEFTQKDRGLSIANCPIGLDLQIGKNYAFEDD